MADPEFCEHRNFSCTLEYASVACNRTPQSVSWGKNGLVAFGAGLSVALYAPKRHNAAGAIEYLLNGHKGRVNCVTWVSHPNQEPERELVSGSSDKTLIVWSKKDEQWQCRSVLKGHNGSVHTASALTVLSSHGSHDNRTLIASAADDDSVIVWEKQGRVEGEYVSKQTILMVHGRGFTLAVALSLLPGTQVPLLACAGEDTKIHLLAEMDGKFSEVMSLQGHEDWIRGLDFVADDSQDLLLASSSQDCFIRVWRVSGPSSDKKTSQNDQEMSDLKLTSTVFCITVADEKREISVVLESVLAGHEDWVYSVHWHPPQEKDGKLVQPMCLLSASMDKTMMIWMPDEESGVWLERVRVGEVGGLTAGLFGGVFSPDGLSILGHGYQGAFTLWTKHSQQEETWMPAVTVSGHFDSVQDIDWDPEGGEFIISVSADQTTRLHAPWKREGFQDSWHEIARPQVHGYDMQCIALLGRYRLASGADEKVVRVFEASGQFLENFCKLCKVQLDNKEKPKLPLGASVPALGLSNKAIFQGDLQSLQEGEDISSTGKNLTFASNDLSPFQPVALTEPPTENTLLQNTLWPETQKLYGHGFEIYCIAASPDGTILASACKASKPEHAGVILWDTESWKQITILFAHSLTVTQISFSHNGQRLLTVSRDRTWALFNRQSEGAVYQLIQQSDRKTGVHTRIIWSCSWSPDDKYFVTGSRDKKVVVWGQGKESEWRAASAPLDSSDPVTAVDFAPVRVTNHRYLLAVGFETGQISIYSWSVSATVNGSWQILVEMDQSLCPVLTVKRLKWRRSREHRETHVCDKSVLHLASCSQDHTLRIFRIDNILMS